MTDQLISRANLNRIESNMNQMNSHIHQVYGAIQSVNQEVASVYREVAATQSALQSLLEEFRAFVDSDRKAKQLQLAETRLVKVRQELEQTFGHYGEVRRRTTGILQAVDVQVVRQETIHTATEQLMLSAPGYWLAPALVALSAWISDRQELAERAMHEAIRRNDNKTSLFFAIVCRRIGRFQASRAWLERYFMLQNPEKMKRETVVLIDALVNGIFGPEARKAVTAHIEGWIKELENKVGFVEQQRERWSKALMALWKPHDADDYPYLRKHSPTWGALKESLEGAELHQRIFDHFRSMFEGVISTSARLADAVDELLDKLVTEFDAEELPLRKEEQFLQLIVRENGDLDASKKKFEAVESALEEHVDFTQLLTNMAVLDEWSHASKASQRYATALSRHWIRAAHDDMTAKNRASVPDSIELQFEGWSGSTRDGMNEEELVRSYQEHKEAECRKALLLAKQPFLHWVGLVGGILLAIAGLVNIVTLVLGALGIVYFFYGRHQTKKKRERIKAEFEQAAALGIELLRALLAETVDLRKHYEEEDRKAQKVTELLMEINPDEHLQSGFDTARAVM